MTTYKSFSSLSDTAKREFVREFSASCELNNPSSREMDWLTGAIMHRLNDGAHFSQIRAIVDTSF